MMRVRSVGFLAAVLFSPFVFGSPAQAQNALCPTVIPGQPGILFQGSSCTNNVTGAYSNAALASQSLGELSESSTQDSTRTTMASIADRRTTESQSCPAGSVRVNGVCQPGTSPVSRFAPDALDPTLTAMPPALMAFGAMPTKARPAVPVAGPHFAAWAQTYGDYEHQTGNSPGLGEFSVLALSADSKTWTGGVLGGADMTVRGLASGNDGLILGVMGGYESSHGSLATSSISTNPASPNGFSTLTAQLSGPTAGVYGSYFNGPFSVDLAERIEFFNVDLAFTDLLGFAANPAAGFPPTSIPFSGTGSTSVTNYTTSANVNYRIPVSASTWVEPTGGLQYTYSAYDSSAEQFGLASGAVLRLQGGGRYGIDSAWNGMRVTTVLTGLLYDNAIVTGGVLANSPNPLILAGEGKLRGEGILAFNLFQGHGVSYLAEAEVEGGNGLFGVGGKAGVRVAW